MSRIYDLRSALEFLKGMPGEYAETDVEIDPVGEIGGVYRYLGANGTILRPTRTGPALLFNNVKGFPGVRCSIGLLGARHRVAAMLGLPADGLARGFLRAAQNPILPITVPADHAACREVVHRADEDGFDLRNIIMGLRNAPTDAGPYITMGIVRASDPETGAADVTIHRIVMIGRDECGIMAKPGMRHIGDFHKKAEESGKPLPITVSIGNDPAVSIGVCFAPPATPIGCDELGTAGGLRGRPIELVPALTVSETAIAHSEYIIEGMMMPNVRVKEDRETKTGRGMAEFGGYTGPAGEVPLIKVTAVTHRRDPIIQVCLGNSDEHVAMSGTAAAAGILGLCERALPGRVTNCCCPSAGGGKFMAILQIAKQAGEDGEQINAGLLAFSAYRELKHVILVDEDVDIYDMSDVVWAMNTRFQANLDLVKIEGAKGHPAEPSASPQYDASVYARGITCKAIFDCTVKTTLKEKFERSRFMELDYRKWFPDL
ncbi:MAG: UbiD family decarboxylase [Clostridiales Family XIII bacterium]|nr:UbiD family decarboxylase [Clostridiales Family XIII bacterium]